MLQQTQVDRVVPKYKNFLKKFPTLSALAKTPLSAVLKEWQGLGYNRRAKMLHETARAIAREYSGRFPTSKEALMKLPGIGPYTASAVRVFAFNEPEVLIETNVRSVFIHHFFTKKKKVHDASLLPLIKKTLPTSRQAREWYSALMDYGSHLKQTAGNASRRSAHHVRQKPFKGSNREVRGAILKLLAEKTRRKENLFELPFPRSAVEVQYTKLLSEGLISYSGGRVRLG
ncbi:A/G-specific adenine glycosylase [Patescibacteria group bacterium]|nr:A/G-specific adenine glycosylase [Patescibacteria group bacterium]